MAAGTGAGYSGTPLARKLGYAPGTRAFVADAPEAYFDWLAPLPDGVRFDAAPSAETELVHLFVTRRDDLAARLAFLRGALRPDAVLWISWPKQASGVATDIREDTVRALALPLGLVDVKVCAVSAVWSGLKLVVRRALR